jgi:hypothetical protein
MCPSSFSGPFPRMFCGKELRTFNPKNDCELDFSYLCKNPSDPAVHAKNCSRVYYNKRDQLTRACDFSNMHLDCTNSTCCDTFVKNRGCSEPFPPKGFNRYRLTLNANYAEERKSWYSDCLLNPKPKYSLYYK